MKHCVKGQYEEKGKKPQLDIYFNNINTIYTKRIVLLMYYNKDIVHVDAVFSFGAVPLDIELAKFFLLVWDYIVMFKLALIPL